MNNAFHAGMAITEMLYVIRNDTETPLTERIATLNNLLRCMNELASEMSQIALRAAVMPGNETASAVVADTETKSEGET